jgi:MoxR-like ATPase
MALDLRAALTGGRARADGDGVELAPPPSRSLPDKVHRAYDWIVNEAVLAPYYDVEFGGPGAPRLKNQAGDELVLHEEKSYSSFVLIPLLTLFTARRALLVGGPGRGKTTAAILMGLVAGMSRDEVRRSIQRGHPQLTIADLLGSPLPSDMLKADDLSQVKVAWRKWIGQRVKIVDEYNRIPTKTQSALLSLMSEGYAEMFDQYVHAGRSAWFLTANDDAGGGTFQVIEALKDRIDVVVRAIPFNSGFLDTLLRRVESDRTPEEMVPAEVVFAAEELDEAYGAILGVQIPTDVQERISFFLGQLDFCRLASPVFESKSKDTLKLAGSTVSAVCTEQCPLDKKVHLCTQTENGVSARSYQTLLHFAKALAWFRSGRERMGGGTGQVELEDVRQLAPFVLHDKLVPNARSPFFEAKERRPLLTDRVAWIRNMFDMAMEQYAKHQPVRKRVQERRAELTPQGAVPEGLEVKDAQKRLAQIAAHIKELMQKHELSGPVYEDVIHLKSMYSRYQNYVHWKRLQGS